MKKLLKTIGIVAVLIIGSLSLFACGDYTDSPATVKITVESVAPGVVFTASRGEVTKNGETYTISLKSQNAFAFSVSADGYETVTETIFPSQMASGKFEKTVSLLEKTKTVIEVKVAAAGEITIETSDKNVDITKNGSTFKLVKEGRGENYKFDMTISSPNLVTRTIKDVYSDNGFKSFNVRLVQEGKKLLQIDYSNSFDINPQIISLDYQTFQAKTSGASGFYELDENTKIEINGNYIDASKFDTYSIPAMDLTGKRIEPNGKIYVKFFNYNNIGYVYYKSGESFVPTSFDRNNNGISQDLFLFVDSKQEEIIIYIINENKKYYYNIPKEYVNDANKFFEFVDDNGKPIGKVSDCESIRINIDNETGEKLLEDDNLYYKYRRLDTEYVFDGSSLNNNIYYSKKFSLKMTLSSSDPIVSMRREIGGGSIGCIINGNEVIIPELYLNKNKILSFSLINEKMLSQNQYLDYGTTRFAYEKSEIEKIGEDSYKASGTHPLSNFQVVKMDMFRFATNNASIRDLCASVGFILENDYNEQVNLTKVSGELLTETSNGYGRMAYVSLEGTYKLENKISFSGFNKYIKVRSQKALTLEELFHSQNFENYVFEIVDYSVGEKR